MSDSNNHIARIVASLPNRAVLRLDGPDKAGFLQGLVSNDVTAATPEQAVYACMLTPQGKFLHDFFIVADGDSLLIECEADRRADLIQRLKTYRLRSKVEIADVTNDYSVFAIVGGDTDKGYADPRNPALGRRLFVQRGEAFEATPDGFDAYESLRISLAVPDGSRDIEVGKGILLENNIDLMNGVSWSKGCYTGQELTARTYYRGLIKKRLAPVRIIGEAPAIGSPLLENGVEIGEMRSSAGDIGLALLRIEAIRERRPIEIAGATLTPEPPPALTALIAGLNG
jgi:folate-binding protein YgfZ